MLGVTGNTRILVCKLTEHRKLNSFSSVQPLKADMSLLYIVGLIIVVHLFSIENIYWFSVIAGSVLSSVGTDKRESSSYWYGLVWEERPSLKWTGSADEHPNVYVSTVVHMIH